MADQIRDGQCGEAILVRHEVEGITQDGIMEAHAVTDEDI